MKKYMMFLTVLVVSLFVLVACSENGGADVPAQTQASTEEIIEEPTIDGIVYKFDELGFSIVLPSSWEGKYGLGLQEFEHDYGTTRLVNVFHPATREELESDYVGWLFSIIRVPWYVYENPVGVILAYDGEYSFLLNIPTDVQWNYTDPESVSAPEYREMSEQVWLIADSFRVLE